MAKINSHTYQYTLILRSVDERCLGGFVSVHDQDRTRRLAVSALLLDGRAAFVEIYPYAAHLAVLEGVEPKERVSLDDAEVGVR